jgi:hypothetical protein
MAVGRIPNENGPLRYVPFIPQSSDIPQWIQPRYLLSSSMIFEEVMNGIPG